jgi:uncharacterized membrane protein YfcA
MIGVTAAASAGVYLRRGYIDPGVAMPVMLGVCRGFGRRQNSYDHKRPLLRRFFAIVIFALAIESYLANHREIKHDHDRAES